MIFCYNCIDFPFGVSKSAIVDFSSLSCLFFNVLNEYKINYCIFFEIFSLENLISLRNGMNNITRSRCCLNYYYSIELFYKNFEDKVCIIFKVRYIYLLVYILVLSVYKLNDNDKLFNEIEYNSHVINTRYL
ncbi:hypothetical protein BOM_0885 (plasmid) [Borrelia miyamotoi FR64b]|nr:hypothetical protein BOM_0885 [Borrelia miyamotoi FR64b]